MDKVKCEACEWVGDLSEVLIAPHPFRENDSVRGCPICQAVDSIRGACDEPDCQEFATCGTPTQTGYRQTCGKHIPKRNPAIAPLCQFDPVPCQGGMFHCPVCGEMVVAGVPHPDYGALG